MANKFDKERFQVLKAAKAGIKGNIKLSSRQKKYVKNLLLFALMNASANDTVTNKNFIKLVNKLFKGFLIKIIKECLDDDDDTDFDEALEVELNKIIADTKLLDTKNIEDVLTPENIMLFLKGKTSGLSQKQLLNKLLSLREAKANHRETPQEKREREQRQKEREMQRHRELMMEERVLTRGQRTR
ncbi:MAG: hypothetical protein E7012_00315 [Alphaproteobacteria bacterium]|nr:hypothetical protein [Alphaproteobacteria bacterium]